MRHTDPAAVVLAVVCFSSLAEAQPIVEPVRPVVIAAPAAPPPPAADEAARRNKARKAVSTGAWLTGISHGAAWSLAVLLGPTDRTAWWLALPIGGPAVFGALTPCPDSGDRPNACRPLVATGGGFWAAIELAGFVTLIAGLARLPRDAPAATFAVGPLHLRDARGAALWGTF